MKVHEMVDGHVNSGEQQPEMAGAQDTIYLCNFRVSVDGEWLCLKELQDVEFNMQDSIIQPISTPSPEIPVAVFGRVNLKCGLSLFIYNLIVDVNKNR